MAFSPATADLQSPRLVPQSRFLVRRTVEDPARRPFPNLDVQTNFKVCQTLGCTGPGLTSETDDVPTNDPCPILALATVRPTPTPRHGVGSYPGWKGGFSQRKRPPTPTHHPLVPQGPRSHGAAEKGIRTGSLRLPSAPTSLQSLNSPSAQTSLTRGPGVVPSISPTRCYEHGPHASRRQSLLQQQGPRPRSSFPQLLSPFTASNRVPTPLSTAYAHHATGSRPSEQSRRTPVAECRVAATCLRPSVLTGHKVFPNLTRQKARHSMNDCSEHLNQPQPNGNVRQTDATKCKCCRTTNSAPIGTPLTEWIGP